MTETWTYRTSVNSYRDTLWRSVCSLCGWESAYYLAGRQAEKRAQKHATAEHGYTNDPEGAIWDE